MPITEMFQQQLQQAAERIDALSVKERLLLLGAILMVTIYAWDLRFLGPLEAKRKSLDQEAATLTRGLSDQDSQTTTWAVEAGADPDASTRLQLAALEAELARVKASVEAKAGHMVAPDQMPAVLKSVLSRFDELEFESLEGLPVEPILTEPAGAPALPTDPTAKPAKGQDAFKHGIRIRFSGSFHAATAYLKALEGLPYGFFWERVELDATDFPRIKGTLVVYTVSLRPEWIGV